MLINGINLSSLGASLHDRVFSSNKIKTTQRWVDGSIEPTVIRQQDSFKNITLQFLVTEQNEENAFIVMSNITMLLKKAIIIFDDMPNLQFNVTISGETKQERLKNGNFLLTVKLKSDYAKGETEIHTTNTAATDSFNLTVVYYKDSTTLVANETVNIRASAFDKDNITFADLGIDVNKYQEDYYNKGVVTNFSGVTMDYNNLRNLGILIINYAPTVYYKDVTYYLYNGNSYDEVETTSISFTYQQVSTITSIGQLVNLNKNRPNGYKATCKFELEPTFENITKFPTAIPVYYDIIENEKTKDVVITYSKETKNGDVVITSQTIVVRESDIVDGTVISDVIGLNNNKPNNFYNNGYCIEVDDNILLTFDTIADSYSVYYSLIESTIYIEYYKGTYPDWSRAYTDTLKIKYDEAYDNSSNIIADLNINLNKYKNDLYNDGVVFNSNIYTDYQSVLNIGVIQIYYVPKEYTLTVKYQQDIDGDITELATKDYILTDPMFFSEPTLAGIIDINLYRPEGYNYSEEDSYKGEVTLSALTAASPIIITYKATAVVRTKSIVIKYKKQLANTYSTINSSIVTIEEAAIGGGIRLKDIFDINKYKPDYYDNGIIDGYSSDALVTFEEINGTYDVYYFASTYSTQIRYYTDEVAIENWIGSSRISYTVLDFETETSIVTLGADINQYKPPYCEDGVVQPFGTTTFSNLINLEAINIVYESIKEPEDDTGIDYPHRILFLQHNDMGSYDSTFPSWTLNHAYINTGVVADDISQTTVTMSTIRMFEDQPLYNVNVGNAYLFGAISPRGSMYIRYENNTNYTNNPTGVNYFRGMAGNGTPSVAVEEDSSNGFSRNTGIYSSDRDGYSYMTLTYSNLIQSNSGNTLVPLYLFACDYNGNYTGGIAGVGIAGCKIYKNGVLVRDYIPVAYYDLIGTKVAPSNCLYDKVTQTFFEDARGLNSFNIIDDEEYEDTNPLHNIGKCYVNYYKDDGFFQSRVIYFREADFINGKVWDPETELAIDDYQPQFYGAGEITNINELGGVTFNNVNNFVFEVHYPSTGYYINVNYYKDRVSSEDLLASEQVLLTEDMFYQVPTFGQLVPLLKYKPEGYGLKSEDYPYTQTKVTLTRLLQAQPFNIVYTPWEDAKSYQFTVSYYKHKNVIDPKHPLKQYEFLGSQTIVVDETQIIDGIYPETFMNFNAMKPANESAYWSDGQTFEWYTKDENLLTPDDLRDNYVIVYEPRMQYIDIKYYTDEIDEDDFNLIASDTWAIKINDWNFGEQFQVADELPNSYINKYKPGNCNAGMLQDSDKLYTFDSLVQQGHLDILYMTKEEPHDPDDDSFPDKVILWYQTNGTRIVSGALAGSNKGRLWQEHDGLGFLSGDNVGAAYQPYLNLGYTPKEIGRLTIQAKAYAVADSPWNGEGRGQDYAPTVDDYTYFFGYYGAADPGIYGSISGLDDGKVKLFGKYGKGMSPSVYSPYSSQSSGWIAMRGHIPLIGGFTKQAAYPWSVDGHTAVKWANDAQDFLMYWNADVEDHKTILAGYRLGNYAGIDENLEYYNENQDHYHKYSKHNGTMPHAMSLTDTNHSACSWSNALDYLWKGYDGWQYGVGKPIMEHPTTGQVDLNHWTEFYPAVMFHPTTVTIDAYNHFIEFYDISNSQNPIYYNIDVNQDYDLFADRCKPKGPLTLFTTTNPDTGLPNLNAFPTPVYTWVKHYRTQITSTTEGHTSEEDEGTEQEQQNQPGTDFESHGGLLEMAYNPYNCYVNGISQINCPWYNYKVNAFPTLLRTAIWGAKVWDRGRLVRDLIPVAKGDQIYDYIAPDDGMFDKVTEIFFTNANSGGHYTNYIMDTEEKSSYLTHDITVTADQVGKFTVMPDPTQYGKIVVNYYDYDNTWLGNRWVKVPTDYFAENIAFKDLLAFNDYKPSIYYHDGILDTDTGLESDIPLRTRLKQVYDAGSVNVYYKQKQYTKTVVYYNENTRIASKDFFFSQHEIEEAETLADLGIDAELYRTDEFGPGVVMSDETIIASDDVAAFIDAPAPIVVYHKYTKEERPDLLYVEYYRGGAYEEEGQESIVLNSDNNNYLDCDLSAVVLNPNGLIKYVNHYHSALYEDEEMPYFIAYQVDVTANYVPIHKGPARAYTLLGHITDKGRYTIIEERNGWGRLKEYPKGWILLSYTQPIVGPGQNPDYDVPTIANVTIPFGTRLSITKMTIDRLWAYTPEYDSWIKTEEISFDQQGRLYSALAMKVIHLDRLNWNSISSLSDMGINVQQYKLRFHNDSSYSYSGDYTQAAFSDLHSIDIVYPETIYPYVVKYYQNTIDENNILGRGGFSCSLSDWNPDWDTFLSTSYKSGYDAQTSQATVLYRTIGKTETLNVPKDEDLYIIGNVATHNDVNCYYVMWEGYVGYMPVSAITIVDETVHTISPVLYRSGKPIMLTWDFYNLDRNLYRPDYSYTEGIMIWNPHTYDNNILNFSFEEIITTGSQKILYVPAVDMDYKAIFTKGWYKIPTDIQNFYFVPTNENPGAWDVEIKYRPYRYIPTSDSSEVQGYGAITKFIQSGSGIGFTNVNTSGRKYFEDSNFSDGIMAKLYDADSSTIQKQIILGDIYHIYRDDYYYDRIAKYYNPNYIEGSNIDEYFNIVNFSNKRNYKQAIAQIYGTNQWQSNPTFTARSRYLVSTEDETGTESNLTNVVNIDYLNIGAGAPLLQNLQDASSINVLQTSQCEFYYIKVWHNYELIHYYIPMPQGYWMPSGEQAPTAGMYDLITQNFVNTISPRDNGDDISNLQSRPTIAKLNASSAYEYFDNWQFNIDNVEYTIKTKNDVQVYKYPDVLSTKYSIIEANTILPVRQSTSDTANHVQGTWYSSSNGWIQASECEIISYDKTFTEYRKRVALKGDTSNTSTSHYGYIRPDGAIEPIIETDYFTLDRVNYNINTYLHASDIGKAEIIVSGHLAPTDSSTNTTQAYGYIFGNWALLTYASSLHASSTRTDVQYTIEWIDEGNVDSDGNTLFSEYINGVKQSQRSRYTNDDENYIRIGFKEYRSPKRYLSQSKVNYHSVKIWDKNGNLIRYYKPFLVYNNETSKYEVKVSEMTMGGNNHYVTLTMVNDSGTDSSVGTVFSGDTSPIDNFVPPISTKNSFTTERLEQIYFSANDFYWNGTLWIPAAYTDDYKIIWDQPKTYITRVTNIYSYQYPIQANAYRVTNMLAGDRFVAVGNLGKDSNWYLLDNGNWVFNNDNFSELDT